MITMSTTVFKKASFFAIGAVCATAVIFTVGKSAGNSVYEADATITGAKIRIAVVRPAFWDDSASYQPLRIASNASDLSGNVVANITYVNFLESEKIDTGYYSSTNPSGSFSEYDTLGIVFYDVPLSTISGKYFDLARQNPGDGTVWNNTSDEIFTSGLNNQIWRIWGDGNGIHRPSGTSAESRNIDNSAVSAIMYGYLTCSSSTDNGFGAYPTIRDNYNLEGRTFLETDTLSDYEDGADYTAERAGALVKTEDKINAMKALYLASIAPGINGNFRDFNKDESLFIILLISALGLSIVSGYYVISRKKHLA